MSVGLKFKLSMMVTHRNDDGVVALEFRDVFVSPVGFRHVQWPESAHHFDSAFRRVHHGDPDARAREEKTNRLREDPARKFKPGEKLDAVRELSRASLPNRGKPNTLPLGEARYFHLVNTFLFKSRLIMKESQRAGRQ